MLIRNQLYGIQSNVCISRTMVHRCPLHSFDQANAEPRSGTSENLVRIPTAVWCQPADCINHCDLTYARKFNWLTISLEGSASLLAGALLATFFPQAVIIPVRNLAKLGAYDSLCDAKDRPASLTAGIPSYEKLSIVPWKVSGLQFLKSPAKKSRIHSATPYGLDRLSNLPRNFKLRRTRKGTHYWLGANGCGRKVEVS